MVANEYICLQEIKKLALWSSFLVIHCRNWLLYKFYDGLPKLKQIIPLFASTKNQLLEFKKTKRIKYQVLLFLGYIQKIINLYAHSQPFSNWRVIFSAIFYYYHFSLRLTKLIYAAKLYWLIKLTIWLDIWSNHSGDSLGKVFLFLSNVHT